MDQIVPVIEFIKKNRFWITCFLLAAAMVATWIIATGELAVQTASNLGEVKSRISTYDAIMRTVANTGETNVGAHPNDSSKKGMESEIDEATQSVLKSWKMRYDAQAEIMKWPEEIASPEFVDTFSQFDPPETFPTDRTGLQMVSFLQIYNMQIPKTMDRICAIIGTEWQYDMGESTPTTNNRESDEDDGGSAEAGEGEDGDETPQAKATVIDDNSIVVAWNEDNQELWLQKLMDFKGRDDHRLSQSVPSPSQVYMLQQDLWLLEAFFNIIKKVNGAADANDLATIKTIDHIAFGREALTQLGEITTPDQSLSAVAKKTADAVSSSMVTSKADIEKRDRENRKAARAANSGTGEGGLNYTNQPAYHGRYVNENFEPVLADDVRKILTGAELPEENLEMIVSKRVPVRFACRMDERKIPEFLTACYQWGQDGDKPSPFIFEVWQVRINRHTPGEGIELQGGHSSVQSSGSTEKLTAAEKAQQLASSAGGGGGGNVGLEGGEVDEGEAAGGASSASSGNVETRIGYDVDVEFYGIVKIYNPVNEALLTGKSSDDATDTTSTETTDSSSDPESETSSSP
ncbi:MAG: hypothetical protein MK108_16775 [Mariniblastus sp.]|nr:hypothetical protein [Mariniblastus sp.]